MPRLPSARLTKALQRQTVSQFYGDKANVLQDTVNSLDVYGQPVVTTVTTAVACSFTDEPAMELWKDYADIGQVDAEIRYAGTPAPAKDNRVVLTGRFDGTGYVDQTFEVVGIRDRDNMGVVVALKKVLI